MQLRTQSPRARHQVPQQQQQQLGKLLHAPSSKARQYATALDRQRVTARVFGNKNNADRQQQGAAGPSAQQQQIDLERLRQQGGYNYPPPQPGAQQKQQPWQWDQLPQQQQQGPYQQQQGPYGQPNPQAGPATQTGSGGSGSSNNGGGSSGNDGGGLSGYTKALIAAAFVTGLGAGVYFDAEINLSPNQVASTEIIDRRTPNAEVCMAYGYSAMVFDQRVFVTYNPFNLYVTQPEVKPGCILRRSNFNVLERGQLVTGKQVDQCKKRMNTFGFVGDLSKDPEVSCVYHSEEAENQYLLNPEKALQLGEGPPAPAAGGAPN